MSVRSGASEPVKGLRAERDGIPGLPKSPFESEGWSLGPRLERVCWILRGKAILDAAQRGKQQESGGESHFVRPLFDLEQPTSILPERL